MCDKNDRACSACRDCPEQFKREKEHVYYDADGALVLTIAGIRDLAKQHDIEPDSDLVEEAIDAAIAGWDAVIDLLDTFEGVARHYSHAEAARSFLGMLSYLTDGPTYDGRPIRVERRAVVVA